MEVKVRGYDRFLKRIVQFRDDLPDIAQKALHEVAERIRDEAKTFCPVDTGSLKKSIRVRTLLSSSTHVKTIGVSAGGYITNPNTGKIVDYAIPVEFGTYKMEPQPYMRPALDKHKTDLLETIKKMIAESRR
jgi:HK97 gp10 family phage protein